MKTIYDHLPKPRSAKQIRKARDQRALRDAMPLFRRILDRDFAEFKAQLARNPVEWENDQVL